MRKLRKLSIEEESEVFNEREIGVKRKDIIKKWGISDRHYKDIIFKNGGKFIEKTRHFAFNENYFENIDTEDKAYFLGFIVADGCISDKTNSIKIIQKEQEILFKFKKFIEFDGNIFQSKSRNISIITVTSEKIKKDLFNLGITPNKTRTVKYPSIPENLQSHFIRGVFDGDGCISIREDKRDGQKRGQFNICSGNQDFIIEFYNKISNYANLSNKNKIRNPKGTYYVVDWGGLSDLEKIHDFLYKDASVFLTRKKETFDKVVSITKEKLKYRK